MRVLMTGGGTGGHVYPALAIADTIRRNCPDAEIAFVGTEKGLESRLVPNAGYRMYPIRIQGLQRALTLSNIKTVYLTLTSPAQAKQVIMDFRPDLVIGTGGYVCWPLLWAAAGRGIPCVLHESNAEPGLAVKMLKRRTDLMLTNFEETASKMKAGKKQRIVSVGNPTRLSCSTVSRAQARAALGISDDRFVVLSFGGSLGAPAINRAALAVARQEAARQEKLVQIMATGMQKYEAILQELEGEDPDVRARLTVKDYIDDMPTYMAAADAVICRAGAMTLTELARMQKPAILIPYPDATNQHQYKNAKVLADAGAAVLIQEGAEMEEQVCRAILRMARDRAYCETMSRQIAAFAAVDTERRVYEEIIALLQRGSARAPHAPRT